MDGLIIKQPWTDFIISGLKDWEIRKMGCWSHIGQNILLLESGTQRVRGIVKITGCEKISSAKLYRDNYIHHRYDIEELPAFLPYGNKTYAWKLEVREIFTNPIFYKHKKGAQIWIKDVELI